MDDISTPFVSGGLNNQANAHSNAYYKYRVGNARFKTESEKYFHKAFLDVIMKIGDNAIVVSPLPLWTAHKSEANAHDKKGIFNIEPDWLIFFLGVGLVLECDGLSHAGITPAQEQDRLLPFDYNGFNFKRIDAPLGSLTHLEMKEWAKGEAEDVIKYMKYKFELRAGRML